METTKGNILLFKDPRNDGWIQGWGVFRIDPWDLAGLYASREEAFDALERLSDPGYRVAYGSHRRGTDDFITDDAD